MTATIDILTASRLKRRRHRPNPIVVVSFFVVFVFTILACFGNFIAPIDPIQQNLALGLTSPSPEHWLGTDSLGRDIFSRVVVGTQSALVGPLVITLGATVIGNILGLLAGYLGGRTDSLVMRWVDLMFSLPSILVIIVVAGAFGGGYWLSVMLLVILSAPADARLVRGATLEQTPRPYVEAAKSIGVSDSRIMVSHIWPNIAPIAIANTTLSFAGALVALAGLSFLGLGVAAGVPDWGLMVSENRTLLFTNPLSVLAPGLMIVIAATAVSILGDWLYERLSNIGVTR